MQKNPLSAPESPSVDGAHVTTIQQLLPFPSGGMLLVHPQDDLCRMIAISTRPRLSEEDFVYGNHALPRHHHLTRGEISVHLWNKFFFVPLETGNARSTTVDINHHGSGSRRAISFGAGLHLQIARDHIVDDLIGT